MIRPLGFELNERRVKRAGLDYWPRVEPRVWDRWESFAAALPELGSVLAFSAEAPRLLWEVEIPRPAVFLFGAESCGLPPEIREQFADRLVRLPVLDPEVRSLNLSTAVAVALYEALRRTRAEEVLASGELRR